MKLNRTATALATVALVGGLASAAPASASTTATHTQTATAVVVTGKLPGFSGNRHQFELRTQDGKVGATSLIRSWYCPSGAGVTPTWASSRCTKRSTYKLSNYVTNTYSGNIGRISASGRSANQIGTVRARSTFTSKTTTLGVNLSLYSHEGDPTSVTGRVGSAPLQATPRYASFGHGTGCGC